MNIIALLVLVLAVIAVLLGVRDRTEVPVLVGIALALVALWINGTLHA